MENDDVNAGEVLNAIIQSLDRLSDDARKRVIKAALTFYGLSSNWDSEPRASRDPINSGEATASSARTTRPDFKDSVVPTPKQFLLEKQPRTDIERIACLAYYLTHYREMPYFKTLDLAKLNTEAAQPKFSNTAYAATNASTSGYLASASGGNRQISAVGEQFVQALPDRDAAKAIMTSVKSRRAGKATRKKAK